jgi:MFS family permease
MTWPQLLRQLSPDERKALFEAVWPHDSACPECGYNLRGLVGDPICCPECGHETARLVLIRAQFTGRKPRAARRDTESDHTLPIGDELRRVNQLAMLSAGVAVLGPGVLIALAILDFSTSGGRDVFGTLTSLFGAVWLVGIVATWAATRAALRDIPAVIRHQVLSMLTMLTIIGLSGGPLTGLCAVAAGPMLALLVVGGAIVIVPLTLIFVPTPLFRVERNAAIRPLAERMAARKRGHDERLGPRGRRRLATLARLVRAQVPKPQWRRLREAFRIDQLAFFAMAPPSFVMLAAWVEYATAGDVGPWLRELFWIPAVVCAVLALGSVAALLARTGFRCGVLGKLRRYLRMVLIGMLVNMAVVLFSAGVILLPYNGFVDAPLAFVLATGAAFLLAWVEPFRVFGWERIALLDELAGKALVWRRARRVVATRRRAGASHVFEGHSS